MKQTLLILALAAALCAGDLVLHNPRGSNNKLSDDNENIQNPRRLFNSNAMYSHRDNKDDAYYTAEGGTNAPLPGGSMYYFIGSLLPIEFTIDNGCGSNTPGGGQAGGHCDIVIQYMCADTLRDGTDGDRIPPTMEGAEMKGNTYYTYGMHENYMYYEQCANRPRNEGLFVGDRRFNANQNTARYTRQNPGGVQHGYECAEERDYYPYWTPTPWHDIAIITDTPTRCDYYKAESQNVKGRGYCRTLGVLDEAQCPNGNWSVVEPWTSTGVGSGAAPDCIEAPWIGEHLLSNKVDGYPIYYNWTIPNHPSMSCSVRVRYNVTTGDYPTWPSSPAGLSQVQHFNGGGFLDHNYNGDALTPIKAQETIQVCQLTAGDANGALCNVTIYTMNELYPSRVYEDRSHRFSIIPRPETINNRIHNLNVRGKRGNIVQTFPSVEYDFVPNVLTCKVGEWVHIQWTGSDNNRNNVAGEGTDQTDRNNIAQMADFKKNFPINSDDQNMLTPGMAVALAFNSFNLKSNQCDPYSTILTSNDNDNDREQDPKNCAKLNPGSPYYDAGLQPCLTPGTYYYLCTRNNNFTNRSQKGVWVVVPCSPTDTDCNNPDELPVNAQGFYDPFGSGSTASSNSPVALLSAVVVLVAGAFLL